MAKAGCREAEISHLLDVFGVIIQCSWSREQFEQGTPMLSTLHLTLRLRHTRQALDARVRGFRVRRVGLFGIEISEDIVVIFAYSNYLIDSMIGKVACNNYRNLGFTEWGEIPMVAQASSFSFSAVSVWLPHMRVVGDDGLWVSVGESAGVLGSCRDCI